jgi:YD repeat-containing protein
LSACIAERRIFSAIHQVRIFQAPLRSQVIQLTDAINGATGFTYDANSNLLTVTDAKSQQTIYTYSNMNRTATRKDSLVVRIGQASSLFSHDVEEIAVRRRQPVLPFPGLDD